MPARRVLVPLRWSDMDAYGHVNNVQFLRLLEDARVALFSGPLLDGGLLVARAEIEYQRPLEFRQAPVAIDVWVTDIRGADFVLGYRVGDPLPEESPVPLPAGPATRPYAVAETMMVPYDLAAGCPRRLRDDEVAGLREWADEPVSFRRRSKVGAR